MASKHRSPVIRVLIADDHALLRKAVIAVVQGEADVVVVGEARDGEEAVDLAYKLQPDVILMDLILPRLSGVDAIGLICERAPTAKVLAFAAGSDDALFFAALCAGAIGCVTKAAEPEEVVAAIRTAAKGYSHLPPNMAQRLVQHFAANTTRSAQWAEKLTPRERNVLALAGQGCTNRTIGEMLNISPSTVRIHLRHAQERLGLHSRTELARFAAQHLVAGTPH